MELLILYKGIELIIYTSAKTTKQMSKLRNVREESNDSDFDDTEEYLGEHDPDEGKNPLYVDKKFAKSLTCGGNEDGPHTLVNYRMFDFGKVCDVAKRCGDCQTQLPDDYPCDSCSDCYIRAHGMTCHNCCVKQHSNEFAERNSVICDSCFDMVRKISKKSLINLASNVAFAPDRTKIMAAHSIKLSNFDREMCALANKEDSHRRTYCSDEARLEEITQTISEKERDLKELAKKKVRDSVYEENRFNLEELKATKKAYINSGNQWRDKLQEINDDLEKLQKKIERENAKIVNAMKQFEVSESSAYKLIKLIDDGNLTKLALLTKWINDKQVSGNDVNITLAHKELNTFTNEFGICSQGLKDLETRIRAGENLSIVDLMVSADPFSAWVNKYVIIKRNPDGTINEKKKVPSKTAYESYVQFASKFGSVINDQAFPAKLLNKCPGVVRKAVNGYRYYKGIELLEEEEFNEETEAEYDE